MSKWYKFQLLFLVLLGITFVLSCEKKTQEQTVYYPNGVVKSRIEYIDSCRNGRSYEYFENGKLHLLRSWLNDTLEGDALIYYPTGGIQEKIHYSKGKLEGDFTNYFESNGNIRMKGKYRQGCLHGKVLQYYEFDNAKVMAEIDYVNYRGEQKDMGSIWFDSLGNVVLEKRRVFLKANSDTIKLGNNFELLIELKKPSFDSTMVVIGSYDDKFNVINKDEFDTLLATNHKILIKKEAISKGECFIRGYVKNWEFIKNDNESTITTEKLPIYFEYSYFVK